MAMLTYVITHPKRATQGETLALKLDAQLLNDKGSNGTAYMHRYALQDAGKHQALILEDDAQPVPNLHDRAQAWVTRFPGHIISLYLGTGHPKEWMTQVDRQWRNERDYVQLPELIHGLCYIIPPGFAGDIANLMDLNKPADYAIGEAWRALSKNPVIYPKESLVEHEDGPPILETHHMRLKRAPRKARRLAR